MIKIEDYLRKELDFNFAFCDYMFINEDIPQGVKQIITFLSTKLSFQYGSNKDGNTPFVPLAIFVSGERSAIFEDLKTEDFDYIREILPYTQHKLIRGRFFDILGVHTNNKVDILNAANEYYEYFKNSLNTAENYNLSGAYKRAMKLYWKSNKKVFKQKIDEAFQIITYKDTDQKLIFFYKNIVLLKELNQNLKQEHIDILENFISPMTEASEPLLEIIKEISRHYKKSNKSKAQTWRIKFADICVEADKKYRHGYHFLQQAIDILEPQEDSEKLNEMRFLLEKSQKKAYDDMQFVSHDLDAKIVNDIEKYKVSCDKTFQFISSGAKQFLCFLKHYNPITLEQITQTIKIQENSLTYNCCNNILFDNDGKIIYESANSNATEKEEYKVSQAINQQLPLCALILDSWQKHRVMDDEVKDILRDITSHNLFIPSERCKTVYDIILKGMEENKLRNATFEIIAQFEYGCRNYLKNVCNIYPVVYKGNNPVSMDLNHILVQKGDTINENRTKIVEIIGEDLTLNIEYLACRKMSGNLRNRNYHDGFNNPDEYNLYELILFYLLIKAYCMGYDDKRS